MIVGFGNDSLQGKASLCIYSHFHQLTMFTYSTDYTFYLLEVYLVSFLLTFFVFLFSVYVCEIPDTDFFTFSIVQNCHSAPC